MPENEYLNVKETQIKAEDKKETQIKAVGGNKKNKKKKKKKGKGDGEGNAEDDFEAALKEFSGK